MSTERKRERESESSGARGLSYNLIQLQASPGTGTDVPSQWQSNGLLSRG